MFTRLSRLLRRIAVAATAFDRDDAMILVGLLLLGGGLWMIYRPAALVAIGVVLLWTFLPARPPWIERPARSERRS